MSIPNIAFAILIASVSLSIAEPAGICLHAYSPEAPADKIECFEFTKVEQVSNGYRFFLEPHGSTIVTKYRYRGTIAYKPHLAPSHPEFPQLLKQYEETAKSTPSARRYLNPRILTMREQNAGYLENLQHVESLPKITIGENDYLSPQFKGFDDGKLVLAHKDGVVKIELDKVTDSNLKDLAKIDPKSAGIKVVEIAKHRLWNPSLHGISSPIIKIKHEKGVIPLEMDHISGKDKEIIMSWSDGTWKIAKPGFYDPQLGSGAYRELVLENGRFHKQVKIVARTGEQVSLRGSHSTLEVPFEDLASVPGMIPQDQERIAQWANEILDERLEAANTESSSEPIHFREQKNLRVTNVRVKILQVLDDGVLASNFFGTLHKGTETIRITKTKSAKHPLSGETVEKIVETSTVDRQVFEDVRDDLCFIVGETANLTEDSIVKAKSIKLEGRYQYVDIRGASRTVRKYVVD